ncbi:MAG: phosphomannomutase/phosphoglucomutase [Bacilli bacterium]|nr:phosphomannomutase/phosphoglucomutase [Bacilli bacterium]
MDLIKNIFREYDIRGVYGDELTDELAYHIGRAFGTKLIRQNIISTVVAYDNRSSSVNLENNLVKGLIDTGVTVKRIGLATTPMCYFAANFLGCNSSMMITASHNPKEYNGFKFSYNGIHNAYGPAVMEIHDLIEKQDYEKGIGKIENVDIREDYINLVIDKLNIGRRIKAIYDCGNGTGSIIAGDIFERLKDKIDYIPLFDVSDGNFPNHHPDPCVEENLAILKQKVLENHADVGIGYDGDADRVGFVDEKGTFIEIDKFLAVMWDYLYDKVDKKECLYDVKCSKTLEDELQKLGVKGVEYRTGNSYTRAASASGDYPLSGELSGHVYFRDKWPGYDDGIYVGMRLIEMISNSDKPLSSYLENLEKYYSTPEIKVKVTDETKFAIVDKMKEYCESKGYNFITIDGVKVKFNDGFALVRASNTGPNITMRFEAKEMNKLKEYQNEFENELKKYL